MAGKKQRKTYLPYPNITWREDTLEENLKQLVDYAVSRGEEARDYYRENAREKRLGAKSLRVIAIIASAIGGLLPVLSQITKANNYNYLDPAWSTVAITVAITAIGLDRFFGFSSAWMRFVTTEIKLDGKVEQFKLNVENEKFSMEGEPLTFGKAKATLNLVAQFLGEVAEIVKDETNTWMTEFQNMLQAFNEEAKVKAENSRLGGITVTVDNTDHCEELKIYLEGQQPVSFQGDAYSFNNLYPKIYRIAVSGIRKEGEENPVKKEVHAETLVNVNPGAISSVALKL